MREENLAGFIRLVAQSSDLHQYTVQKLYSALKSDISQASVDIVKSIYAFMFALLIYTLHRH